MNMKALFIQPRRLGDVLMTTPSLRALKTAQRAAEIDFWVERTCAQAVAGRWSVAAGVCATESLRNNGAPVDIPPLPDDLKHLE